MSFCRNCGQELYDTDKFCAGCGIAIVYKATSSTYPLPNATINESNAEKNTDVAIQNLRDVLPNLHDTNLNEKTIFKYISIGSAIVLIFLIFQKLFIIPLLTTSTWAVSLIIGLDLSDMYIYSEGFSLLDATTILSKIGEYYISPVFFVIGAFFALSLICVLILCKYIYKAFKNIPDYVREGKSTFSFLIFFSISFFITIFIINLYFSQEIQNTIGNSGLSFSFIKLNSTFYIMAAISIINRFFIFKKLEPINEDKPNKDEIDKIQQVKCPNCNKLHDCDYPKCPFCNYENEQ